MSKGGIRTWNLRSKCQSANHYTVETIVWGEEILFTIKQFINSFLFKVKKTKICYLKKNHFSETSGNLGFWLTLYEGLDPKGQLLFNAIGRQVAAYTFLEFFKIGFLWYELRLKSKIWLNSWSFSSIFWLQNTSQTFLMAFICITRV